MLKSALSYGPYQSTNITFTVSNIIQIADVLDLEDFGPGYALTTSDGELVVVYGQIWWNVDCGEDFPVLKDCIHITTNAQMSELKSIFMEGEPVEVTDDMPLEELNAWQPLTILKSPRTSS